MVKSEKSYELWGKAPGLCLEKPMITSYLPEHKASDGAIVIFPGGGYHNRAGFEGRDYAEFLASHGYSAFVVDYRVFPHEFPLPLLDARRAVRWVRYHARDFGLCKDRIAVMGSSAGGHLAALVSTYMQPLDGELTDEADRESFLPDAQILCYPVIRMVDDGLTHPGSIQNFLGDRKEALGEAVSPNLLVNERTPKAFLWHTFDDECVNLVNSLDYVKSLHASGVETEFHVFPQGVHGLGLAMAPERWNPHVSAWSGLLLQWLSHIGF